MKSFYTPIGVTVTAMRVLTVLCVLLVFPPSISATPHDFSPPPFSAIAKPIEARTVLAARTYTFVANGAFAAGMTDYRARLADGTALPYWMRLDAATGTFTLLPAGEEVGNLYTVVVTARNGAGSTQTTTFNLLVSSGVVMRRIKANPSRKTLFLGCHDTSVRLVGESYTGTYHWTGPNGFFSKAARPTVDRPGLYVLSTSAANDNTYRAVVEVRRAGDCPLNANDNREPTALIASEDLTAVNTLNVTLDATGSHDDDGKVVAYRWDWDGGSATGPKPRIDFGMGTHEVVLTVTDDYGARSTDRINITVTPPPVYADFWLEAECAIVGNDWETVESDHASEGSFVVMTQRSPAMSAPATAPGARLRFKLNSAREGDYTLFARVSAGGIKSDSYWVRVNNGEWIRWSSGIDAGRGFRWNELRKTLSLKEGSNIIDFAYREPNTRLDKLFVTMHGAKPKGRGETASNCAPNLPPVAVPLADVVSGTAPLNVQMNAGESFDEDGEIVAYRWTWNGKVATGPRPRATFAAGEHTVYMTVTDDEGATHRESIVIRAEAPAPPPSSVIDDSFWLEAECAAVGSSWTTEQSDMASAGSYVVVHDANAMSAAPAGTKDHVRFIVDGAAAGSYTLFARIDAPTNLDDSYWVRLNDGEWFKWNSGMAQGEGFAWNRMPLTLELTDGLNIVDFAYREDGTKLDKLFLTATNHPPTGMGVAATNCTSGAALEAECAYRSDDGWNDEATTTAAGGSYMTYTADRFMSAPTADKPGRQLAYDVTTTVDGDYSLYLRVDAPDAGSNSLWVSVDGGEWIKFWEEIGGDQLLTDGLEWRLLNEDGVAVTFALSAGTHTVRIAGRETGTGVDKLYLTTATEAPAPGFGPEAPGCTKSTPMGRMNLSQTPPKDNDAEELAAEPLVDVYPNPATDHVKVDLESDFTGPVAIQVYDARGRRVINLESDKQVAKFSVRIPTVDLPAGMYHLRVMEDDRTTVRAFVQR